MLLREGSIVYSTRKEFDYKSFWYACIQTTAKGSTQTEQQVFCRTSDEFNSLLKAWNEKPAPEGMTLEYKSASITL